MTLPGSYQTGETGTNQWSYAYDTAHVMMPGDAPDKLAFQLTSITDDQGRRVNYKVDATGKISQVRFDQTFDGGGNPTSYCQADYTYDQSNGQNPDYFTTHEWLVTLRNSWNYKDGGGTWHQSTLVSNGYTIDNVGQRLTNLITSSDGSSRTEVYGYDPTNRLTSVDYGDGQTQGYSFDAMGNRLQKTDSVNGNESYSYDNANRLLTRGSNSYTNDIDGNTLTGGGRTNVWDSENRLVSCTYNGTSSTYTYGSDGLRRRATVAGTTTDFVLDATMQIRELHGGVDAATYLVGARGPEYRRDGGTGAVRWYLYDGLGPVLGELDPSGNVTASRKFDVYGGVRSSTGTSTSKHKFVGSLGHPSDDESGLIYMRARYMDPQTGRFVSEDPGGRLSDLYTYCANDPINRTDWDGKVWGPALFILFSFIITFLVHFGISGVCLPLGWQRMYMIQSLVSQYMDLNEQIDSLKISAAMAGVFNPAQLGEVNRAILVCSLCQVVCAIAIAYQIVMLVWTAVVGQQDNGNSGGGPIASAASPGDRTLCGGLRCLARLRVARFAKSVYPMYKV